MSNGAVIGIGVGVVLIGGVLFFVVHSQNQAAVAQANAAAAAAARAAAGSKGSTFNLGDALATLGGRALEIGANYWLNGGSKYAMAKAQAEQVSV